MSKLFKKLTGMVKTWAWVGSGIGLTYYELFFKLGPSSRVRYPFQLYSLGDALPSTNTIRKYFHKYQ